MKYLVLLCLFLTGCATGDYKLYSESISNIEISKHNAESEKYKAMAVIAASGSETAKVAAVMAMVMQVNGNPNVGTTLRAPESAGDSALKWGGLLIPSLTQIYSIRQNTEMGMRQSDNNAGIAMSTNNAFVGMAGKIQAPVTVLPQANVTTTTTNTLSGTGTLGSGAFSTTTDTQTTTTDNHAATTPVFSTVPVVAVP